MIKNHLRNLKNTLEYPFQKSVRIFPSIFIAGFQKCGTTSLYDYLSQLPSILPGEKKEKNNLSHEVLDLNNYIKNFPKKKAGKRTLCGSHQLTYFPQGFGRLQKLAPDAKIVVIMRNPVDRAYSRYHNNLRGDMGDKDTFEEALDIEFEIIKTIKDLNDPIEIFHKTKWRGYPEGAWDMTYKLSAGMYMTRGIYHIQIQRIIDHGFDFHPMFLEHLKADFKGEMGRLLDFLEIDRAELSFINPEKKNPGKYKSKMADETRERLESFFEPHNQKLFELLGIENPW